MSTISENQESKTQIDILVFLLIYMIVAPIYSSFQIMSLIIILVVLVAPNSVIDMENENEKMYTG